MAGTEIDGTPPVGPEGRFGGPAESEEHKRLKNHIYAHPQAIGASLKPEQAKKEFLLLSGDKVDVYLCKDNTVYLVEVKSIKSNEQDLCRGIYQCIKYKAVFKAQRQGVTPNIDIRSILVVERKPPSYISDLAKIHAIEMKIVPINN